MAERRTFRPCLSLRQVVPLQCSRRSLRLNRLCRCSWPRDPIPVRSCPAAWGSSKPVRSPVPLIKRPSAAAIANGASVPCAWITKRIVAANRGGAPVTHCPAKRNSIHPPSESALTRGTVLLPRLPNRSVGSAQNRTDARDCPAKSWAGDIRGNGAVKVGLRTRFLPCSW